MYMCTSDEEATCTVSVLALSEPCPGTFYHLSIILLKHACSVVECIL